MGAAAAKGQCAQAAAAGAAKGAADEAGDAVGDVLQMLKEALQ